MYPQHTQPLLSPVQISLSTLLKRQEASPGLPCAVRITRVIRWVPLWREEHKTPQNQTMPICLPRRARATRVTAILPLHCFGFLARPATCRNQRRDAQSKWAEKLYSVHVLECPPGKLKPSFLGTVNTSGSAKNFSHLLTIPLVYPPEKND